MAGDSLGSVVERTGTIGIMPQESLCLQSLGRHPFDKPDAPNGKNQTRSNGNVSQNKVDVLENDWAVQFLQCFETLLVDRTTGRNILWCTEAYAKLGAGFGPADEIKAECITGAQGFIIQPRAVKSAEECRRRIRENAEVFTPLWIVNKQNNLVDEAWFGRKEVFNREKLRPNGPSWSVPRKKCLTMDGKIRFSAGRSWMQYVRLQRMEISCGEAPYLASRYDPTNGVYVEPSRRVGMLDRKLRVVNEYAPEKDWFLWAQEAFKSIYGFEWQGDSLLIARETLFYTFIDYYRDRFRGREPSREELRQIATILSWNLWQMDGLRLVVPNSCHDEVVDDNLIGLPGVASTMRHCPGCVANDITRHNGIPCKIMDWDENRVIEFRSLMKGSKQS